MLNVTGLTITFIGSFITLITTMTSKYKKGETTWRDVGNLSDELNRQKKYSIVGFFFMSIGFLLQIISAYLAL